MTYDLTVLQQYGVNADVISQLTAAVKNNYGDSFGESFSRLTLKGSRFSIRSGSSDELLSNDAIEILVLGDAKADHCVYFKDKYDPNLTDVKPTAVWYYGEKAPAIVPQIALNKDASGRFGFTRQHRAVILIKDPAKGTWMPTPIVYDIGSMSLYGTDVSMPDGTSALSYASFRRWCATQNVPPFLVPTRVIFDRRQSVPCVRFIPAKNGNSPMIIEREFVQQVLKLATSQSVKELLDVKLIDGTEDVSQQSDYVDDEAALGVKSQQPKSRTAKQKVQQEPVAPALAPAPAPAPESVVEPVADPVAQADEVLSNASMSVDDELNSMLNEVGAFK